MKLSLHIGKLVPPPFTYTHTRHTLPCNKSSLCAMLHFGMSRAVRLLSVFSCRSSKWGWWLTWFVEGGSWGWYWVVDLLSKPESQASNKQTSTHTHTPQDKYHIVHRYMDIVTWQEIEGQRGSKTSVSALRRDQDSRAMAKRGGMEWMRVGNKGGGTPFWWLWWDLSCWRGRRPPTKETNNVI